MSMQAGLWHLDERPAEQHYLDHLSNAGGQSDSDESSRFVLGPFAMLYAPFHTTKESRRERQPCCSPQGVILTWDGRLDNREELVPKLRERLPNQSTDAAIILSAYHQWGPDFFRHIKGDWALSMWDPRERKLFLARDYVGIRQLYYCRERDTIVWSTSLASLALLPGVRLTLDDEYIADFLASDPEAHRTPYQQIQSVPPGNVVEFRGDIQSVRPYFIFPSKRQIWYRTDSEYEEHFRHVFRQAVRRRLRSDTPILAELSGGIDSSSIVCMADDIIAKGEVKATDLHTLSYFDTSEPGGDERSFIARVEEKRGEQGIHISTGNYTPLDLDTADFLVRPGPLGSSRKGEEDMHVIMQKGGHRVLLSGFAGDEFMGGVPSPEPQLADLLIRFRWVKLSRLLNAWSLSQRRPAVHLLLQAFLLNLPRQIRCVFAREAQVPLWIDPSFAGRYHLSVRQLGPARGNAFWLPSRRTYAESLETLARRITCMPRPLVGCYEYRYPYLDQDLVEFVVSIPPDQLLRPGERRSLMRRSLAGLVPAEILWRRTKGTGGRHIMAALGQHWADIRHLLAPPLSSEYGYVRRNIIEDALTLVKHGQVGQFIQTMKAFSLELWLRNVAALGVVKQSGAPSVTPSAALVPQRH